jgi:hypothetical protein
MHPAILAEVRSSNRDKDCLCAKLANPSLSTEFVKQNSEDLPILLTQFRRRGTFVGAIQLPGDGMTDDPNFIVEKGKT